MNVRPLSQTEENNLAIAKQAGGDFSLLFVTQTGLAKAILDATLPLRTLLKERGIHDFNTQGQGPEHKVVRDGVVVEDEKLGSVAVSLYRPVTKNGDPRMWPSRFSDFANPDDVFAVFVHAGTIHFFNLTRSSLTEDLRTGRATAATKFFNALYSAATAISAELLALLRAVAAKGPLEAVCLGDTAIGRSIEAALGIGMNALQTPDYKGIELKSFRSTKPDNGLMTLFSKTPDWGRSGLKGSRDFWTRFAYERDGGRQLYCSVYATKPNSQGLRLHLNASANDLEETHAGDLNEVLAVWSMDTLHDNFRRKHAETFWVKAHTTRRADGREFFELHSVTHTKQPLIAQFDAFILDGQICLDHTINQRAKDHGYLFRVRQEKFTDLFTGTPSVYPLS